LKNQGGHKTYAVGHLSLGYIISKSASSLLKVEIDTPLIFALSVLPDIDILIPFLNHRGPTHFILIICVGFIPLFIIYGKKAVPYLAAIIQHPLLGDYLSGGKIQLFWPISSNQYGIELGIKNPINVATETIAFTVMLLIMLKTRDLHRLFHSPNIITLIIPTFTLVSPTLLKFPIDVPSPLIPPHIILATLFISAILAKLKIYILG